MNYRLNRGGPPGSLEGRGVPAHQGVHHGIARLRLALRPWGALQRPDGDAPRPKRRQDTHLLALTFVLALLGSCLLHAPPIAMAQDAERLSEVSRTRDQVLESGEYQTDPPAPREPEERPEQMTLPAGLVEAILWVIGGIVVVMIAVFLYNALQNRSGFKINRDSRQASPRLVETPISDAQREQDARTLEEADALAAEGRFAEAIHLLLLVAMDRLKRELGNRLTPALTGREVLQLAPIPGAVVEPLTRMVSLSEIKHFGGRDAAAPDYAQCRDDFLAFSGLEVAS